MDKITSFTIDHNKLQPGIYVSRKDKAGDATITTFDLRMTSPHEEPVIQTAELHTIEQPIFVSTADRGKMSCILAPWDAGPGSTC